MTRVIDIKKLEKKYHSYESKRQLRDSYDLFLADDRIITYLAKVLGKTFYATTPKRPIPVHLQAYKDKSDKKKNAALPSAKPKKESSRNTLICTPKEAGHEIERTLCMTQVNLAPSVTTSIRVGLSSQNPEQVAENIDAVVTGMTEKHIPRQWRGVKAIHVKGPNTMALPIWLADELWEDEKEVLEDQEAEEARLKASQKGKRKRQLIEGDAVPALEDGGEGETGKKRKSEGKEPKEDIKKKKRKLDEEGMSQEMKERRQKLKEQKRALKELIKGEGSVEGKSKKARKTVS